jgi:hypothetical protein
LSLFFPFEQPQYPGGPYGKMQGRSGRIAAIDKAFKAYTW